MGDWQLPTDKQNELEIKDSWKHTEIDDFILSRLNILK
jgi:hypothetical protein